MLRYALVIMSLLMLPSCVTSTASTIPGVSYPALPSSHPIAVYAAEIPEDMAGVQNLSQLPSGTQELGRVAVNGAQAASWNSVLSNAKQRARKMGGDALIVESWGFHPVTSYSHSGGMTVPVTVAAKNFSARVIRLR